MKVQLFTRQGAVVATVEVAFDAEIILFRGKYYAKQAGTFREAAMASAVTVCEDAA